MGRYIIELPLYHVSKVWFAIKIESIKTTSMEDVSTTVLKK